MGSGGSERYVHMLVNEEERVIFLKVLRFVEVFDVALIKGTGCGGG